MEIESLDEFGRDMARRAKDFRFDLQGPFAFEHGFGWSPNITFVCKERRVHFFFENMEGRIYVVVEAVKIGPPREVRVSRIQDHEEGWAIINRFLRSRCEFEDLPGHEWLQDVPTHDAAVPHPIEGAQPGVKAAEPPAARTEPKIALTGAAPARIAGIGGVVLYSNDPDRAARWYRGTLGAELAGGGGGAWSGRIGQNQFSISRSETPVHGGSVMISYAVANFDTFVAELVSRGAELLGLDENQSGKFAYTRDPDGNPVEIWGPPSR